MRRSIPLAKACGLAIVILLCSGPLVNCECGGDRFGAPQLEVDKTSLKFDDVAVGYPQQQILTITNLGGSGLTLDTVAVQGGDASPFTILGIQGVEEIEAVPDFVGPGASIELVIEYDPASEDADDHDVLDLLTNDPDECNPDDLSKNPCAIQLSGEGAPPNAELEVVCQSEETCPPPNDTPVCQVMMDPGTNEHPMRVSFNFCEVSAGANRELRALLKNVGNIPLIMEGFELFGIIGEVEDFGLLEPGQENIEIPPGGDQMLTLIYAPDESGSDNSGIDLMTNDDDLPDKEFTVRMLASSFEPDIDVHPLHLPFEGVTQGGSDTQDVTVENTSSGTLEVTGLELTGGSQPGEFTINPSEVFSVPGMGQQIIQVTYSPADAGRDDGSLKIYSNDVDESPVVVTLGADVRPDLEATPRDFVEFVGVEMGGSDTQEVSLRNVGYAQLTITAIAFDPMYNPGDPPVFGVEGLPGDFPGNPLVIMPADEQTFQVTFTDNTSIENEMGQLEIEHDSPSDSNPYILVAVSKDTPANLPPVAVIEPPTQTVQGLDPINIDGSDSFDPDAGDSVDRYHWSFLFLPKNAQDEQSQATLDNTDQPTTSFTPDMHGTYIVRLVVYDTYNTPSQPVDTEISVNP